MTEPVSSGIAIGKHPCPECGGDLEWNAAHQALRCPYCGTIAPWSPPQDAELGDGIVEQDLLEALAHPASGRGWGEERHEVKCQSCHAISVSVGTRAAQLRLLWLAGHRCAMIWRCDHAAKPAALQDQ